MCGAVRRRGSGTRPAQAIPCAVRAVSLLKSKKRSAARAPHAVNRLARPFYGVQCGGPTRVPTPHGSRAQNSIRSLEGSTRRIDTSPFSTCPSRLQGRVHRTRSNSARPHWIRACDMHCLHGFLPGPLRVAHTGRLAISCSQIGSLPSPRDGLPRRAPNVFLESRSGYARGISQDLGACVLFDPLALQL